MMRLDEPHSTQAPGAVDAGAVLPPIPPGRLGRGQQSVREEWFEAHKVTPFVLVVGVTLCSLLQHAVALVVTASALVGLILCFASCARHQ
jgi:hypothetical protein